MTITESAVVQRIRRKLRKAGDGDRIYKTHSLVYPPVGVHYLIRDNKTQIFWRLLHKNLEAYARDLGVLRAHESVAE